MKQFIEDLLYHCSSNNTKSRGFYIFVTVMLALVAVGIVVLTGLNIFMLIKGWWKVMYLILLIAAIGLEVGACVWLNKSN